MARFPGAKTELYSEVIGQICLAFSIHKSQPMKMGDFNLENIEKLSQRAQSLASLSSSAKFSVSIPAQVIENGIVDLDFSVLPSSQSPDRRGKSNKEENKYIQEFWLWGFVAHYLRLLL